MSSHTRRPAPVAQLIVLLCSLALVVGLYATWANRLLWTPNTWARTSASLLADRQIRTGTAGLLVNVVVDHAAATQPLGAQLLGDVLPGGVTARIRKTVTDAVATGLDQPVVRSLWADANRAADASFIAVASRRSHTVVAQGDAVVLRLGPLLNRIVGGIHLPFGLHLQLPGTGLDLTLFRARQIPVVLWIARTLHHLSPWLLLGAVLGDLLAVGLATGARRRVLALAGLGAVAAGALALALRALLGSVIAGQISGSASAQAIAHAVWRLATLSLLHTAVVTIVVGAAVAALGGLAGLGGGARPRAGRAARARG